MNFSWDSLYIIILFIIPGFVAISIRNALFREDRLDQSPIELSYKSILHSCGIYFLIYTVLTLSGQTVPGFMKKLAVNSYLMIIAILSLFALSFIWGLVITSLEQKKLFNKALRWLGILQRVGQPPNVYARFLDQEFRESEEGVWVIFQGNDDILYEGWVEYASVTGEHQEIYVTEVRILNPDRTPCRDMHEISGIIVRISDLKRLEIIE